MQVSLRHRPSGTVSLEEERPDSVIAMKRRVAWAWGIPSSLRDIRKRGNANSSESPAAVHVSSRKNFGEYPPGKLEVRASDVRVTGARERRGVLPQSRQEQGRLAARCRHADRGMRPHPRGPATCNHADRPRPRIRSHRDWSKRRSGDGARDSTCSDGPIVRSRRH